MSVWFLLWLCLLISLMSFLGWTFIILVAQKTAWKKYAAARKLRYKHGSLMASPEMEGEIDKHKVSFFTSEHLPEGARGSRKLTAVEVNFNSIMPIDGGVASGSMVPVLGQMNLTQEYRPKHAQWNETYVASGSNRAALEGYLNDERVAALCKLMAVKNAWVILAFRNEAMLLRVDIASPLDKANDIDRLAKQMLETAKVLELKKGEAKKLKALADKPAYEAQADALDGEDENEDAASSAPEDSEKS